MPGASTDIPSLRDRYCEARLTVDGDTFDIFAVGALAEQLASASKGQECMVVGKLVKESHRIAHKTTYRIRIKISVLELKPCQKTSIGKRTK